MAAKWVWLALAAFGAPLLAPAAAGVGAKEFEEQALWGVLARGAAHKDAPEIKKLIGTKISVAGWIIPNEYESGEVVSFLLARYPGGCVHVPLPPPENVIYVTMSPKSKKLKDVTATEKVLVEGTLKSASRIDASFEMEAESAKEVNP